MSVSISADIDRERLRGVIWARRLTQGECWVASLFSPVQRCPQPVPSLPVSSIVEPSVTSGKTVARTSSNLEVPSSDFCHD